MASKRSSILQWAEQGLIPPERLLEVLDVAGVAPDAKQWARFVDRFLLWTGSLFLGAGAIFFFAYNWQDMGRVLKFGIAEALIIAAIALYIKVGEEKPFGKAMLFLAAVFIGVLLALFGQVYQTGADTWELFANWALLILPWVLVGRFAAIWILWLIITNLAIILYFQVFHGVFWLAFSVEGELIALLAFNSGALLTWELGACRFDWLAERWAMRLLAAAGVTIVTMLILLTIYDYHSTIGLGWMLYPVWIGALFIIYLRIRPDLFMLAAGCMSLIVVVMGFLAKHIDHSGGGGYLAISFVIIGMSAVAAYWLRHVHKGMQE
jgi:uncharacterized membrane protein